MANFSQQIANFIQYGTYNYVFDSVGNEILNPSSSIFQQVYFSLPIGNFEYNSSNILKFYDPEFSTFTPTVPSSSASSSVSASYPQAAIDQINTITYQNKQLQQQLTDVIALSQMNTGSADTQNIMSTIIALRIQLGQGITTNDFQTTFPYNPVPITAITAPPG
jgi:hypothetical protein